MIGKDKGAVSLLLQAVDANQTVTQFHCLIHNQVLCLKVIEYDHVMKVVVNIVNSIRSRGLRHRQFRDFLNNIPYDTC